MIPGIMAGQARPVSAGAVLWTPLNMAVVPQIYLDAQDSAVTDVSGACSAISNLGAMGSSGDFSQVTAGRRPAILGAELGGKQVLRFDGADDYIEAAGTTARSVFRDVAAAWAFAVYKKRNTDVSATNRYLFYASQGASSGARFGSQPSSPSAANTPRIVAARSDGDSAGVLVASGSHSGAYRMMLNSVNYSTRAAKLHLDGVLDASTATLTGSTGNTSNTVSQQNLSIGAFAGGLLAADIDLAAIVVSNTYPSDSDIDKLFGWAAHKYGLTANLPSGHPYKTVTPTV